MTPDSAHYLAAADHVAHGDGFRRLGGDPMASWPPLYPATLAVVQLLGGDTVHSARWLNLALTAGLVFICFLWASARLRSRAAVVAVTAAAALGPPIVFVSGLALTDLMFLAFQAAALFACDLWLAKPSGRRLAACAAATALACLTRYPGVILAWTILLVMLWRGSAPLAARIRAAAIVGLATGLPLGLWLLRNLRLTGTFAGPRYGSESTLIEAAVAAGQGVMSWFLPWRVLLQAEWVGFAVLVALVAALAAIASQRRVPARQTLLLCVVFVAGYLGSLIVSVATMQLDLIGDRMLAPLWIPLIFAGAEALRPMSAGQDRFPARAMLSAAAVTVAAVAVAGAAAVSLTRTAHIVIDSWNHGPGGASYSNFNTLSWRTSPTAAWARDHISPSALTFATSPAAAYIAGQIDARPMPRRHARRSPGVRIDDLPSVQQEVADSGGAYLLYFNGHLPANAYQLDDLRPFFELEDVATFKDGRVIRLTPHAGPECHVTDGEVGLAVCDRNAS